METYKNNLIHIFFGDKTNALFPDAVRGKISKDLVHQEPFITIKQAFSVPLQSLVFGHQTHGIQGIVVSQKNEHLPLFTQEGDFLVTTMPGVGIGVATADCMPIVLFDPVKKAVGVVHAGWKGLVSGVVEQAVERMYSHYGSSLGDMHFIVGPSARVCCYEVGKDFIEQASVLRPAVQNFLVKALIQQKEKLFFDAALFLKLVFFEKGLQDSDFNFTYAACTICEPRYCSYRREKMSPLRQLTIVSLK